MNDNAEWLRHEWGEETQSHGGNNCRRQRFQKLLFVNPSTFFFHLRPVLDWVVSHFVSCSFVSLNCGFLNQNISAQTLLSYLLVPHLFSSLQKIAELILSCIINHQPTRTNRCWNNPQEGQGSTGQLAKPTQLPSALSYIFSMLFTLQWKMESEEKPGNGEQIQSNRTFFKTKAFTQIGQILSRPHFHVLTKDIIVVLMVFIWDSVTVE